MAITIDNKTYRNLEEQVLKNKEDIARHYEVDRVLADWGIKVIGVVDSVDNIPEADYEYGDAFGLSSTDPMQYVIWTRANANVGQENDYWLNIGSLTIVGPTGPQGNIGPTGPQGERGSYWFSGSTTPTASTAYKANDHFINTTNGDVYIYTSNSTWTLQGNIRGPQGVRGVVGAQGVRGPQGPIGPQGPKGDTGASFQIGGLLESADLLPTPTESNRHIGYAVKNADGTTYDLYVAVGTDSLMWVNMGRVEGVEGPQGPIGPQGVAGVSMQNITYAELLDKVNTSGLTAGELYRITDYVTTTTQENTRSAGHQFDIIVIANSVNTLNENAYAIQHEGDTYFTNSKLNAWQIKYDINNNKDKYYWADTTNGKGVIYYMKDEYENACFYDFKNIQFVRKLTDGVLDLENGTDTWCYTFNCYQNRNNVYSIVDASISIQFSEEEKAAIIDYDDQLYSGAFNNKIDLYFTTYYDYRKLNDIVFLNLFTLIIEEGSVSDFQYFACHNNTFGKNCDFNTFSSGCDNNTFGDSCSRNTFGIACSSNTFGDSCSRNTFGDSCDFNTFSSDCDNNTFSNDCGNNTFSSGCHYNTFGDSCSRNTFGDRCTNNTLGIECDFNTFGDSCSRNTFGDSVNSNIFGIACSSNTFGNNCYSFKLGNDCQLNTFGHYIQYIECSANNSYISLNTSDTGSASNFVQYVKLDVGLIGTSSNRIEINATRELSNWVVYKSSDTTEVEI